MKLLDTPINSASDECAREVLDVIPQVMRLIRAELREHREAELSVTQFRSLAFLDRHSGASLSELAEHIGLALPSMSKLVDGLVERGLVTRQEDAADRRRVVLCLTLAGDESVRSAREATQDYLSSRLASLAPEQCATIMRAMEALRAVFVTESWVEKA
jgi:DNA-binding MarR family transcriptional regulator